MNGTPTLDKTHDDPEIDAIDWEKVGKIYKPESAVEHIVNKEMGRVKQAFDINIEAQDEKNAEMFAKGGKKK